MRLIYNGKDMTQYAKVKSCVCRDQSSGRSDTAEIEFYNGADWLRWEPETDDAIEIQDEGYTTGRLFLSAVMPENDKYTVLASGMKARSWHRQWQSYEDMTLGEIAKLCAAEGGLTAKFYGISENIKYRYLMRKKESAAGFMNGLCEREGCGLKTMNGRMCVINLAWAEAQSPVRVIYTDDTLRGMMWYKCGAKKWRSVTVKSPDAEVTAMDASAWNGIAVIRNDLAAFDGVTAGRWARGLLQMNNRQSERLHITLPFEPALTAFARVDIGGNTQVTGKWIVDEAEHDFIARKTRAWLMRCVTI